MERYRHVLGYFPIMIIYNLFYIYNRFLKTFLLMSGCKPHQLHTSAHVKAEAKTAHNRSH